ncbi:uncharacterized protein LOC106173199 [Lingula anatina]|uniref:Uncharacterized protein LOC106173199 n=1 Tax=Lingula anatina TaxID=7574 RepID=A0A2R2MQK6_LINAN|nr:uncharacterized protein LOC106173199 [Lingula anatina]|eukprot:XP_023932443.1 uncharacterized protein LOC106173199 [Lingula anatina]
MGNAFCQHEKKITVTAVDVTVLLLLFGELVLNVEPEIVHPLGDHPDFATGGVGTFLEATTGDRNGSLWTAVRESDHTAVLQLVDAVTFLLNSGTEKLPNTERREQIRSDMMEAVGNLTIDSLSTAQQAAETLTKLTEHTTEITADSQVLNT